jgi:hypothetical protein
VQTAARIRILAEAEAEKVTRIGLAEAISIEEQVRAYGGPKYQITREMIRQLGAAVAESKCDMVPKVLIQNGTGVSGNGGGGGGTLFESMLGLMLSEQMNSAADTGAQPMQDARPEVSAMRSSLKRALEAQGVVGVKQ